MTKDKALEELFLAKKPHFDDHDTFMANLTKRLDAVEFIHQHQEATIRRYKMAMIATFVIGIISGAITMAFILSMPADVPLFNFHVHTGLLLWFTEISRPVVATALALLMTIGSISVIINIQDINTIMNMNKKTLITMMLALVTMAGQAQTTVKGHVINERGENIEYVSIGIEEDSVGVISDAQGHFTLTIPAGRKDELTFTHVSYQTVTIPYTTYADGHELTITLKDKVVELAEVVVGKKNKPHTLSGKSWVRTGNAGFVGSHKGDVEWGPIFENKKDYLLTDIMFSIATCKYEECLLSFNCYEVKDKKFVNILNKPIYKRVTPTDNGKELYVSPEETVVLKGKKKYCVTVCLVDMKGDGALYFPANIKSSYARNKVKGKMKKLPGCPMIIVKGYEVE